jgi:hypothetical protein
LDDSGGDFVTRDARKLDHRISAAVRIQIAAAEADHTHAKQNFPWVRLGPGNRLNGSFSGFLDNQRPHRFQIHAPAFSE